MRSFVCYRNGSFSHRDRISSGRRRRDDRLRHRFASAGKALRDASHLLRNLAQIDIIIVSGCPKSESETQKGRFRCCVPCWYSLSFKSTNHPDKAHSRVSIDKCERSDINNKRMSAKMWCEPNQLISYKTYQSHRRQQRPTSHRPKPLKATSQTRTLKNMGKSR